MKTIVKVHESHFELLLHQILALSAIYLFADLKRYSQKNICIEWRGDDQNRGLFGATDKSKGIKIFVKLSNDFYD